MLDSEREEIKASINAALSKKPCLWCGGLLYVDLVGKTSFSGEIAVFLSCYGCSRYACLGFGKKTVEGFVDEFLEMMQVRILEKVLEELEKA